MARGWTTLIQKDVLDADGEALPARGKLQIIADPTITEAEYEDNEAENATIVRVPSGTVQGAPMQPLRCAVSSNVANLAAAALTADGVTLATDDRVGLFGQTDQTENGFYLATVNGGSVSYARAADMPSGRELLAGLSVAVQAGDAWQGSTWTLQGDGAKTVGTDALRFVSDVETIDASRFGLLGGGADDTAALTAWLAAAGAGSKHLTLPLGDYNHTGIAIPAGVRISGRAGAGFNSLAGSSRLIYTGSGGIAYTFQNVLGTHVEDIVLDGGKVADVVLGMAYLASNCAFERVTICGAVPGLAGGTLVDIPGTLEIDNIVFRRCNIEQDPENGAEKCQFAIHNENSNALDIHFEHSLIRNAKFLSWSTNGSCSFYHNQMFGWDEATGACFHVGTNGQSFTVDNVYTEGTDGLFLDIFPAAGTSSMATIRLRDCTINSAASVRTACTQRLVLENLSTGGNVEVEPSAWATGDVVSHRTRFSAGKGFTGSGALTHVNRYDDSEEYTTVTRLRNVAFPMVAATADAHLVLGGCGTLWAAGLTEDRAYALPGGAVVQSQTGPTVGHTGTPISENQKIVVKITLGGALGVGEFDWSRDGGSTWEETGVTLPGGGTYALGTTGYTATFAAGTYLLDEHYLWSSESVQPGTRVLVSRASSNDGFKAITAGGAFGDGETATLVYETSSGWVPLASSLIAPRSDSFTTTDDATPHNTAILSVPTGKHGHYDITVWASGATSAGASVLLCKRLVVEVASDGSCTARVDNVDVGDQYDGITVGGLSITSAGTPAALVATVTGKAATTIKWGVKIDVIPNLVEA